MKLAIILLAAILLSGCVTARFHYACGVNSTTVRMPHAKGRNLGPVNYCNKRKSP